MAETAGSISGRRAAQLVAVAGPLVLCDQATKAWAEASLAGRAEELPVIDGAVSLLAVHNPGAFFGLGASLTGEVRVAMFACATLLATALIGGLHLRSRPSQRVLRMSLGLLLAGAVGNLIDRMRIGEVIDFLHLRLIGTAEQVTVNLADVFITAGLALVVIDALRARRADRDTDPSEVEGRDARATIPSQGSPSRGLR
ncbi:MAG: signal peptidase II [Sandaracinaceae bacterium]